MGLLNWLAVKSVLCNSLEPSTAYHAVAEAVKRLEAAGFKGIKERDNWSSKLLPGGKVRLLISFCTVT